MTMDTGHTTHFINSKRHFMLTFRLFHHSLWCVCLLIALPALSTGLAQKKIKWNRVFRQTLTHPSSSCLPLVVGLQLSPLIGGPGWLPVHVKVVLETEGCEHKWDFVPLKPSDPTTLSKLVKLQAVPGEIRYFVSPTDEKSGMDDLAPGVTPTEEPVVGLAREFCELYPDRNLNVVTNNCWTFAFQLYSFLSQDQDTSTA
jgi:hypothetical protein